MKHFKYYLPVKSKVSSIVLLCFFSIISNDAISSSVSFTRAKIIAQQIFSDHQITLYCACKYNNKNEIDLASCHMQEAQNIKRAKHVEWEHMMPAENFGRQFICWREKICKNKHGAYKGRKCCEKVDSAFRAAEAELYNLWPAVGLVNQARSNYRYAVVNTKQGFYGCDFNVDRTNRKAEPTDAAKGIAARVNLFMAEKYNITLSDSQRKMFAAWDEAFPPTEFEKIWANRVAQIEGYQNHYITHRD